MSTRCTIHLPKGKSGKEVDVYYHHYDGYPEGVGKILMLVPFTQRTKISSIAKSFNKHMSYGSVNLEFDHTIKASDSVKMFDEDKRIDNTDLDLHSDIEWRYRVQEDGSVKADSINTGETFHLKNETNLAALIQKFKDADMED